jgi:hypothetical protein
VDDHNFKIDSRPRLQPSFQDLWNDQQLEFSADCSSVVVDAEFLSNYSSLTSRWSQAGNASIT